jgi:predicted ferric reductase
MKPIKIGYLALLLVLTVLWLPADPLLPPTFGYFDVRHMLVTYTGIIGIGVMSVGMLLALRPVRIEPLFGGLDKTYRLHKWLGITALVVSIIHWLWAQGTKWAVGWGLLTKPHKGPQPEQTVELFRFFRSQRGLAESIGEWAFYALVLLVVLALLKRFPYRYFFKTHRVLALVYLALVVHSVVLMPFEFWSAPIGLLMLILMAGGTLAAFISLFQRVGYKRRAVGEIEEVLHHRDNRVLKFAITLKDRWPGHQAGQFAFVTLDPHEGAHPYTISSAWHGDGRMFFLVKGLGDYTNTLPDTVKVGDLVNIEGPYGRFDFSCGKPRQIWVAGGIGITPFIARLQALAKQPDGKAIDLFYSTKEPDEGFIERVRQLAQRAGVRLHVLVTRRDGRLDGERIRQLVPEWSSATFWFCGPAGFGQALHEDFKAHGLAEADFHQELFDMR